jgi:molybdate transport system substrate-binding protein
VTIEYSFAGSGTLEQTIRSLKNGDLYMPGATKYIDSLAGDGLVVGRYPVALHVPSVIVRQGETKVRAWEDLAKEGVRIAMPDPTLASSGKASDQIISNSPLEDQIRANIVFLAADTRDVIAALQEGKVDAAFSWRSAIGMAPGELVPVEIPEEINAIKEIWIAVPTYTVAEQAAVDFAEYVASVQGQGVFEEMGFLVIN